MRYFFLLFLTTFFFACTEKTSDDNDTKKSDDSEITSDSTASDNSEAKEEEEEETDMPENANPKSPKTKAEGEIGGVAVAIDYSSPRLRGREVFGKLVKYDKVWRTGADDASKITLSADLMLKGTKLPKGEYALFTIPKENGAWTVIFNTEANQWGSSDYKDTKDALRLEIEPTLAEESKEEMTFSVKESAIVFEWDKIVLEIPATPAK